MSLYLTRLKSSNPEKSVALKALDVKVIADKLCVQELLLLPFDDLLEIYIVPSNQSAKFSSDQSSEVLQIVNEYFSFVFEIDAIFESKLAVKRFLQIGAGLVRNQDRRWLLEPLRAAYEEAAQAETTGPVLHWLFQKTVWLHEKIRMETRYFQFAVFDASIVREVAGKVFGSLVDKQVAFAGEHRLFAGFAQEMSNAGAQVAQKEAIDLNRTDVMFFGDQAVNVQFDKKTISQRMTQRHNTPFVVFDFSNAAQFANAAHKLYNVFSYVQTDLARLAQHNTSARDAALPEIEQWLDEECATFFKWVASDQRFQFAGMIGQSQRMQRIFELISRVARTNITVLIDGESGTGKELVARAIHKLSSRSDKPFIAVNCGAIPDNLLESELFGHEKGAFTGAIQTKHGLFEAAHSGTIFLDEIAELQPHLQVKLLRFLQEGEIKRIGGNETQKLDVRVVAATNQDLKSLVDNDNFRSDLYYRLNVLQLTLPALRERKDDILLIARYFLHKMNDRMHKAVTGFTSDAERILLNYTWPGNVRELENAIERAVALAVGDVISAYDLPSAMQECLHEKNINSAADHSLKAVEKAHIIHVLDDCDWNYEHACKVLGIGRTTLWRKLREYGVTKQEDVFE